MRNVSDHSNKNSTVRRHTHGSSHLISDLVSVFVRGRYLKTGAAVQYPVHNLIGTRFLISKLFFYYYYYS